MEKQETSPHLQRKRDELLSRRERYIHCLAQAARCQHIRRMRQFFRGICQTNEFLESLDLIAAETRPKPTGGRHRFAVSSLFLHECFKKLTADQAEQFFFITGSEIEGVFVLDQVMEFAHQKRTMMGVQGDTRATHGLLIKLEQFGHRLLAHFHSHPGNGVDFTRPSGTDESYQQRLESAGHMAVMAIFSRDGFVRFVRLDENFEIEIYGNGVEKHATGIYRLTNLDPA
jgi:hypothetical protein